MEWLIGTSAWKSFSLWAQHFVGVSPNTLGKLLNTLLLLVVLIIVKRVLRHSLLPHIDKTSVRYRISKFISLVLSLVVFLFLVKVWLSDLNLATYFGILSAGLAIALKDPLMNMAGWIFIVLRAPFTVGDRIQLGDHSGDVVDISAFSITVLEVGNWVHADQSTGRIIQIPNGHIFSQPCANYTAGFDYIWHEIPVNITFESDYERAHEILTEVINRHARHTEEIAAQVDSLADRYRISYKYLTPIVWLTVVEHGVLLTIRYLCHARRRRSSADRIWREILDAFSREPEIDLAYQTTRFFDQAREGKSGGHPRKLKEPLSPYKTQA